MPCKGSEANSEGHGRVAEGLGSLAILCLGDGKGRSPPDAQVLRLSALLEGQEDKLAISSQRSFETFEGLGPFSSLKPQHTSFQTY